MRGIMVKNKLKFVSKICFLTLAITTAIIFLSALSFYVNYQGRVLPGVTLEGINLSGKNKLEAKSTILEFTDKNLAKEVNLIYKTNRWSLRYEELGLTPEIDEVITKAFNVGRERKLKNRLKSFWKAITSGYDLKIHYKIDHIKLEKAMSEIKNIVEIAPVNASYLIKWDNTVEIKPGKMGKKVNDRLFKKQIVDGFKVGLDTLNIPVRDVMPDITTSDVYGMKITGLLAEYETFFNENKKNRSHNVKLAAKKLDGVEIPPGENFSFNETIGPRTEKQGFKEATVIVGNKFTLGLGGGVCQVSSTLYNSVLKAGLSIVERENHSLIIGYVPMGLDATVVYGYIDFKFLNETGGYVVIRSKAENGRLIIKIFGCREEKPEIKIVRNYRTIEPPLKIIPESSLPKGTEKIKEEGKAGYKVEVIRYFYRDGNIFKKKKISSDYYPPEPKVVIIGTN